MPPHTIPTDPFFGPLGINAMAATFGISPLVFGLIFAVVALWSVVLKGIGLWFAARNDQKPWFIVILLLNTFGILEIVYLLFFRKDKQVSVAKEEKVAETEKVV
ncbi:MAG TPA: DUF5652 family protein [Candidatus Paceibacterota bacterium]|nr:DUF5652 family protein [Candidatus Paceibacterota bacterium]